MLKVAIIALSESLIIKKSESAKNAKKIFSLLLDTARAEPVLIEQHGRAVAGVVAIEEYEKLKRVEESSKIKGKSVRLEEVNKTND